MMMPVQQIGLVSAPVQSIITDDCCPDWDPAKGPDLPILLPKLPSARAEAALGGNPSTRMYKMLATAQRVFTTVMGHTVLFPRYVGIRVLPCLDDLIFAATTSREALTMGQMLLCIHPAVRLAHPPDQVRRV